MKAFVTGVLAGLLMGCLIGSVKATDTPQTFTCAGVRAVVALFKDDIEKAVKAARDAGATTAQIAWARRCISS